MRKPDLLIIIPAYNEEENIGQVLQEIRKLAINADIIIINDGSQDATEQVVRAAGEQVISLFYNIGYGGALQTGFKYAVKMDYRYVIQFDGDGQHDPRDILILLEELRTGDYDIVIGSRFLDANGPATNVGVLKRMAIAFFRFLIKVFTGVKITDPTSGIQGLSRAAFRHYAAMGNFPEDYPDADTVIFMLKAGYKVKEIPANIRLRDAGTSMHTGLKPIYYLVKMLVSIFVVLLRGDFRQARNSPHDNNSAQDCRTSHERNSAQNCHYTQETQSMQESSFSE